MNKLAKRIALISLIGFAGSKLYLKLTKTEPVLETVPTTVP